MQSMLSAAIISTATLKEHQMSKIPKNIHQGYEVLITEVLPKLENFQTDITKHDKASLKNYEGDFISLYRDSGTHLFKKDDIAQAAVWTCKNVMESIESTHIYYMNAIKVNSYYIYVSGSEFRSITAEEAKQFITKRYEQAKYFYENTFKHMYFESMANEIFLEMLTSPRRWKANLKAQWDDDSCTSACRRLRNYFADALIKIKSGMEIDDIRKVLINHLIDNY